jgi:hypothetical protein
VTTEEYYKTYLKPKLDPLKRIGSINWFNKYLNPIRHFLKFYRKRCSRKGRAQIYSNSAWDGEVVELKVNQVKNDNQSAVLTQSMSNIQPTTNI